MKRSGYVCTKCSQTFTRMASGIRHNSNLHLGTAGIVSLIDYIVGRSTGRYLPSSPRDFKLKKARRISEPVSYTTKRKTRGDKVLEEMTRYVRVSEALNEGKRFHRSKQGFPFLIDFAKRSVEVIPDKSVDGDFAQAREDLVAIEQMLTQFHGRKFALDTVKYLVNLSNSTGDYSNIHEAFNRHRRNIRERFNFR